MWTNIFMRLDTTYLSLYSVIKFFCHLCCWVTDTCTHRPLRSFHTCKHLWQNTGKTRQTKSLLFNHWNDFATLLENMFFLAFPACWNFIHGHPYGQTSRYSPPDEEQLRPRLLQMFDCFMITQTIEAQPRFVSSCQIHQFGPKCKIQMSFVLICQRSGHSRLPPHFDAKHTGNISVAKCPTKSCDGIQKTTHVEPKAVFAQVAYLDTK